jgi:YVTN family beta-propeller protein
VDVNTLSKIASIPCNGWTEKMLMIYNKVFVTNLKTNYVYVINALSNQKTDSVFVGLNASSLILDKNDKVWVLAGGNRNNNSLPRLTRIDPVQTQVEKFWEFSTNDSPVQLCLNKTKDTLFYLNKDVYKMDLAANALPSQAFIAANNRNFYGMGVHPSSYEVYLADALDYVQRSNIFVYTTQGKELTNFKAGLIANGFYFE